MPDASPTGHAIASSTMRWPHIVVLATVLLTYGFELFNFNVSADEPLYWNVSRSEMMDIWNNQGRWGMGLTSWLLPATNGPVVPLALGLVAATCSLWWLARHQMRLGEWESAFATCLAVSMPALVFHFSFSINSLGLGLAYAACAVACALVRQPGWGPALGAVAAGAYAIGVYEGFAFVLVTFFLAVAWWVPTWVTVARTAGVTAGAAALWFVGSKLVTIDVPEQSSGYVGTVLGLDGIAADPVGRAVEAVRRMVGILGERWLYFGYSNPLPAVVLLVLLAVALRAAFVRPRGQRLISLLVVVGLLTIPLVAAFLTKVLFQRAMVFLPTIVVILCGIALPVLVRAARPALVWSGIVLGVAAVAGQATIANGAFYSGTIVVDDELAVTSQVAATYRSLPGTFGGPLPAVVASRSEVVGRPDSWSARSSFEAGVMGSPETAVAFMRMRGLDVVEPTDEQSLRGQELLRSMPAYPQPGYMQMKDGLLLINLSTIDGR